MSIFPFPVAMLAGPLLIEDDGDKLILTPLAIVAHESWHAPWMKPVEQPRQDLAHTGHGVQVINHLGEGM